MITHLFRTTRFLTLIALALFAGALVGMATEAPAHASLVPATINLHPGADYGPATRTFQGIPGLARAPGGRLWATWYSGGDDEGPENYVVLATSEDNGNTWSELNAVIDPPGDVRAFDPVVWVDPQGRLWWFYAQSYRWWDGRAGVWAVTTAEPDQLHPQWTTPRRLADGVMMNKPTVLRNGDWLFPVAGWSHEPRRDLAPDSRRAVPSEELQWDPARAGTHIYRSRDQGATVALLGTARIPDVRFDEHMIVERRDGSLWLLARTNTGIAESISTDGGRTWSAGQPSSIPHVPSRFFIRRLLSGSLLLVKHNPPLDAAWLAGRDVSKVWQQRSHLTAYVSADDGRTWQGGLLLDDRLPVAYPDGDQAPDGTLYIAYDFNRKKDKEIYLARFTEKEVRAGRISHPGSRLRILINRATGRTTNP